MSEAEEFEPESSLPRVETRTDDIALDTFGTDPEVVPIEDHMKKEDHVRTQVSKEDHMMTQVSLAAIAFDAETQIRAAVSDQVVSEYAERMADGVTFPPVVLFHDGTRHHMADGFHRGLAAKLNGATDISATVKTGTQTDALWYALGANRANGHRLTPADKKHAILLALKTWPKRSANQLAEQIGVAQQRISEVKRQVTESGNLPARVTGKDGRNYPAQRPPRPTPSHSDEQNKRWRRIRTLAVKGRNLEAIADDQDTTASACRVMMQRILKKDAKRFQQQLRVRVRGIPDLPVEMPGVELPDEEKTACLKALQMLRDAIDGRIADLTQSPEPGEQAAESLGAVYRRA